MNTDDSVDSVTQRDEKIYHRTKEKRFYATT